jgi:hypothetical protein
MSGAKPLKDDSQAGDDRQQPAPKRGSGGPIDEQAALELILKASLDDFQAALSQVLSELRSEHGKARRRRRANGKGS